MSKVNVSLPQGTRDFAPAVLRKRQYITGIIKDTFERYGFEPLETPAMENLDTLMGKYGEEGDKLIFKILNNGLSDPKNVAKAEAGFANVVTGKSDKAITERALRYDLTIPFARFVAMNHGQLTFPFRRYQVQPVWRADRPQKGRYREFYQCDADIVGSHAVMNEVELAFIYHHVFKKLQLDVDIRINDRKILYALAEKCGDVAKLTDITTAIDKLDKIGIEKVKEELLQRGLTGDMVDVIERYLAINGTENEKLAAVRVLLGDSESAQQGIASLEQILEYVGSTGESLNLVIDFTLARGLNYYTGTIFEVNARNVKMGSIGGGGRYDDLTGLFGVPGIPGVGISFGLDRIFDVMEELKVFPESVETGTKLLFFNLGIAESRKAFYLMQQLRSQGINSELYHEQVKFDKQFKYAEKKHIPYVAIIGSEELAKDTVMVKDLDNGTQESIKTSELSTYLFR